MAALTFVFEGSLTVLYVRLFSLAKVCKVGWNTYKKNFVHISRKVKWHHRSYICLGFLFAMEKSSAILFRSGEEKGVYDC
jgi:hypothetical protein